MLNHLVLALRGALASGIPYLQDTLSPLNKFKKDTGHINLVITIVVVIFLHNI